MGKSLVNPRTKWAIFSIGFCMFTRGYLVTSQKWMDFGIIVPGSPGLGTSMAASSRSSCDSAKKKLMEKPKESWIQPYSTPTFWQKLTWIFWQIGARKTIF
jgi:hypothetical protein